MGHKTREELNIFRQAILDHCKEPSTAKIISSIMQETYGATRQIMDTLVEYKFLEAFYVNAKGSRRKFYKTLIETYTPPYRERREDDPVVKVKLSLGGRHIPMRHIKVERKSPRTHVGISQVYNG